MRTACRVSPTFKQPSPALLLIKWRLLREPPTLLAPQLLAALKPGDTVLVKGSNGAKMSVIVEALKARQA